jgi:hypothetical protein
MGAYAIIGFGRTLDNPSGLARRRFTPEGRVDESLQRDLSLRPDVRYHAMGVRKPVW